MPYCSNCQKEISAEGAVILPQRNKELPNLILCPVCAENFANRIQSGKGLWVKAFVSGGVCSAIAIAIWFWIFFFLGHPMDFLSALVGWAVASILCRTSSTLGRRTIQWMACSLTIVSVFIREFLLIAWMMRSAETLPLSLDEWIEAILKTFPHMFDRVMEDPFIILIWVIAVWVAFITPVKNIKSTKTV